MERHDPFANAVPPVAKPKKKREAPSFLAIMSFVFGTLSIIFMCSFSFSTGIYILFTTSLIAMLCAVFSVKGGNKKIHPVAFTGMVCGAISVELPIIGYLITAGFLGLWMICELLDTLTLFVPLLF